MSPLQHKIYLKVFGQSQKLPFAKGRHLALCTRLCRYDLLIWGYMYPQKWWFATEIATFQLNSPGGLSWGFWFKVDICSPAGLLHFLMVSVPNPSATVVFPSPKSTERVIRKIGVTCRTKMGPTPRTTPQTKNTWHDSCYICNCGQKDTARERTKLLNIIWCTLHECSDEIANILGPWMAPILTQLSGAPWSPSIPLTGWLTTRPSVDRYLLYVHYVT